MPQIGFDAVITEAADSSKLHIDMKNICTMEIVRGEASKVEGRLKIASRVVFPKGGKISLQSSERFRKLLPITAPNVLNDLRICSENFMKVDAEDWHSEFSVCEDETEKERLNNENQNYTIAFRFRQNGHYYIALTNHVFNEFVCGGNGSIFDRYILQASSLESTFFPFDPNVKTGAHQRQ